MPNKKAVFLFGAGAVLDWGGPKTICFREELTYIPEHGSDKIENRVCCFTHLITATGFYAKDGERITNKILKILLSKNTNGSVNFETIINIIEDLYTYWAAKESKESNNLYSIANIEALIADFYFFEHTKPNSSTGKYSISIPKFPLLKDDFVSEMHPIQKYYEMLLNELLSGIKGHVSKYTHSTSGSYLCDKLIDKQFYQWMKKLVDEGNALRMYTLNYDRKFSVLLQNNGLEVFEGFELDGNLNPSRIISDFNSHIHYNLHGSAYWGIEELNINSLPGYQYFLSPFEEIDNPAVSIEIEKGKKLLLTNIITGHQKVQRTAISPFRQMLSAFDRDCFEADTLYIIGYSFGDEHINDIIRNARKYNTQLEIILIEPNFDDKKFMIDFLLHWGIPSGMVYKEDGEHDIISPDFNVRIIQRGFGEFLQEQQ